MSSSNWCFLTCIQIYQEADQVVWYCHLDTSLSSGCHTAWLWLLYSQIWQKPVRAQLKNAAKFSLHSCCLLYSSLEVKKLLSLKCLEFQIDVLWKVYTKMICFFQNSPFMVVSSLIFCLSLLSIFIPQYPWGIHFRTHHGYQNLQMFKSESQPSASAFYSCRFNQPQTMKYFSI